MDVSDTFYLYFALICTVNGFVMFLLCDEQNKMTSPIEIHSYTMRTIEAFVWEELVTFITEFLFLACDLFSANLHFS